MTDFSHIYAIKDIGGFLPDLQNF